MSTKEKLINWINKIEDENLLAALESIMDSNVGKDWYDDLIEEDIESIKRGLADHRNGKTYDSKEFWKKL